MLLTTQSITTVTQKLASKIDATLEILKTKQNNENIF